MAKLSAVANTFTPSPIQQLSLLAQQSNAINLAEGFPDFPAPAHLKNAAVSAINSDFNQYRHVQGICDDVGRMMKQMHGLDVDPLTDIAICCGQTEAFAAAIFAVIDPGDEVVLFDPSYETYESCIRLARGIPVFVALDPPYWTLDANRFMNSFTSRTKAVILNRCTSMSHMTMQNIFLLHHFRECKSGLSSLHPYQKLLVSQVCPRWRVGWAIGPALFASAIRNIHVKVTDSAPAPFQEAALTALKSPPEYYDSLRRDYESKRDCIMNLLAGIGFEIKFKPQGSFFLFVELPEASPLSDMEFVEKLIKEAGVVAVPGCGFFHPNSSMKADCQYQKRYIRFAFCKSDATLAAAAKNLGRLQFL
ncbi:uncharacterized protein LOC126655622 isoform X2 [Mercurialis annua]|uniref:uncharacterized protein LOC126655622 isoform X2 n=1 Tax=Mercurialis annua TaxID=3986 RepID=UPI00215F3DB9|nr:uncharacterized protein LOC126655622 isoform X2 [Mercurialis annua]